MTENITITNIPTMTQEPDARGESPTWEERFGVAEPFDPQNKNGKIRDIVNDAVMTFIVKQREYGNTDEIVVSAMKALYPSGVPLERYYEAIFTLKILEKLSRLSSLSLSEERLRDAYKDVVGYGLLGVDAYNREIENKEKPETT